MRIYAVCVCDVDMRLDQFCNRMVCHEYPDILPSVNFQPNDQYSRECCTQACRTVICCFIAPLVCCCCGRNHCEAWVEGTYCAFCWGRS